MTGIMFVHKQLRNETFSAKRQKTFFVCKKLTGNNRLLSRSLKKNKKNKTALTAVLALTFLLLGPCSYNPGNFLNYLKFKPPWIGLHCPGPIGLLIMNEEEQISICNRNLAWDKTWAEWVLQTICQRVCWPQWALIKIKREEMRTPRWSRCSTGPLFV